MRQWKAATVVAAIGLLVAACGSDKSDPKPSTTTTTTTTTATRPPVAQPALGNLLLTPAELDSALGVTGSTSAAKTDKLTTEDEALQLPGGWKWPDECLFASAPGEAPVYANSGFTAVSGDIDVAIVLGESNDKPPTVNQMVVLFPSANEANAFFTASSQRWPACANRQFSFPGATIPGIPDLPKTDFQVGPVSNANAILTTTVTSTVHAPGADQIKTCQRALTVRNNIAIDVSGCRTTLGDMAVNVLNQIGGKVDPANANLLAGSVSKGYGLNNCQPAPPAKLTGPVLAELDCGQSPDPAGPVSAIYRLLPDADALANDFKNMTQGIAPASCGPGTGQTWQQGQASGQMTCGTQKDAATIVWTTNGKNVLGVLRWSNGDINALNQWWLGNG
jgi:hypothetical protein